MFRAVCLYSQRIRRGMERHDDAQRFFSHGLITFVGKEFWNKIGIDYEREIIPNLKKSIQEVEKLF